jgi:hypothetical protein
MANESAFKLGSLFNQIKPITFWEVLNKIDSRIFMKIYFLCMFKELENDLELLKKTLDKL